MCNINLYIMLCRFDWSLSLCHSPKNGASVPPQESSMMIGSKAGTERPMSGWNLAMSNFKREWRTAAQGVSFFIFWIGWCALMWTHNVLNTKICLMEETQRLHLVFIIIYSNCVLFALTYFVTHFTAQTPPSSKYSLKDGLLPPDLRMLLRAAKFKGSALRRCPKYVDTLVLSNQAP